MRESTLSSPFGKNKNLPFLKKKRKKNIPFFEYKKKSGELRNFLNLKNRKVQIFLFFLSSFFKEKKGFSFFFFPFKLFFCFFYTGQKNNLIFLLKDKYSLELKYKNACLWIWNCQIQKCLGCMSFKPFFIQIIFFEKFCTAMHTFLKTSFQ